MDKVGIGMAGIGDGGNVASGAGVNDWPPTVAGAEDKIRGDIGVGAVTQDEGIVGGGDNQSGIVKVQGVALNPAAGRVGDVDSGAGRDGSTVSHRAIVRTIVFKNDAVSVVVLEDAVGSVVDTGTITRRHQDAEMNASVAVERRGATLDGCPVAGINAIDGVAEGAAGGDGVARTQRETVARVTKTGRAVVQGAAIDRHNVVLPIRLGDAIRQDAVIGGVDAVAPVEGRGTDCEDRTGAGASMPSSSL